MTKADLRAALDRVEAAAARVVAERDQYRQWHWGHCECHDSWDQCPCAEAGHPRDGSCGCCDLGTGLCGPKPVRVRDLFPKVTTSRNNIDYHHTVRSPS